MTEHEVTADDEPVPPPDSKSLRVLFRVAGVRNYLFAGLAAVAMVFVVMFQRGSDIGGALLVIVGGAGLVLRWAAAPSFFLLILTYFLLFPFGFPEFDPNPFEIEDGRFRVVDLVLVAAVLVYLAAHYRVYGLTAQAMPSDLRYPRPGDEPVRRPAGLIRPGEIGRHLSLVAGLTLAGQFVWLVVSNVEIDVGGDFPLKWAGRQWLLRGTGGDLPPALTRFVVAAGLVGFGTLLARVVFGYWRLRRMSPGEGGMILQDAAWDETRREQTRQETWRAWARRRAERRAKSAAEKRGDGR